MCAWAGLRAFARMCRFSLAGGCSHFDNLEIYDGGVKIGDADATCKATTSDKPQVLISVCLPFIPQRPQHLAGGGGENGSCWCTLLCSAASPALEAHGGAAGELGHHIDLALTDTCRGEGGVRKRGGEVIEPLASVIKHSPWPPHGQETAAVMPPPNPTRLLLRHHHSPEGMASLGACHRCTQSRLSNAGKHTENKQCWLRHWSSPSRANHSVTDRLTYHLAHLTISMIDAQTTRDTSGE